MSTKVIAQRGITLIEQIVFIVIVSVGVVALVSTLNPMIRASADPMRTKQMVAIAEGLLNEIMHQPFTWCDPDDPAASTAQSYAGCASPQNTGSFMAGESRLGGTFDNVDDYGGYSMANVTDVSGGNAMAGYNALVDALCKSTDSGATWLTSNLVFSTPTMSSPPIRVFNVDGSLVVYCVGGGLRTEASSWSVIPAALIGVSAGSDIPLIAQVRGRVRPVAGLLYMLGTSTDSNKYVTFNPVTQSFGTPVEVPITGAVGIAARKL